MTDQDVRDMLRERAASITPSPDGFERIQAKLEGGMVTASPASRRRFPVLASAAAVAVLAMIGTVVVAQRDDTTRVEGGPLATTPTSAVPTSVPRGVWPWPGDAVDESVFTDAGDTARAYVASRVLDVGVTTEAGRSEANGLVQITFGGDVVTTVFLRQHQGRWYVESAVSDLVTLHDAGDGTVTARVETGGRLTRTTATSGASDVTGSEPIQVAGGEEYAGLGYTLGRDDVALRELFVLDTVDGTTGITEIAFTAGTAPAAPVTDRDGVWPWPGDFPANDDAWRTDPRATAERYVRFRLHDDIYEITSEFREGDSNSGEVVIGGDISTTVLVRQLDGVWHVEAATTDLVELLVEGDEVAWTVPGGGELTGNAEGEGVEPDQRGPVRYEPGSGGSTTMTEATGIVRHWFTLVADDGTVGLAEVRVDHGDAASEASIPEDALSEEGGLDAMAVAQAYLTDRLGGRTVTIGALQGSEDGYGEVPWEAGVVILRQGSDGTWFVTEAIGDSVQIESATVDDGGYVRGELRLAQAGSVRLTYGDASTTISNDLDAEDTIVPFELHDPFTTSTALRVVFETDTGMVSLAERVVSA